jgi:branched-chain amino acid transport system ATP-binding protein
MDQNHEILLDVAHLSIQFGGLRAVDDLSMQIRKGELYGLIGPNGAGKTTVFNILTGVYKPTEGIVRLDGADITGKKTAQINLAGIARTFQNIRLFKQMSVIDNVKCALQHQYVYGTAEAILHLGSYRQKEREMDERAMSILSVFGLEKERDTLSANLPYGRQRKLEIARAMATGPKLLLLDEPAAGMNPSETSDLMDTIRKIRDTFKICILLIEHDMNLVMGICEGIAVLNFGQIIAKGTPEEIQSNPQVIEAYLGRKKEA